MFGRTSSFFTAMVMIFLIFSSPTFTLFGRQVGFQPASAAGACLPLVPMDNRLAFNGWSQPVCYNVLISAGITHYWAEEADVIDNNLSGACAYSTQFIYDSRAKELSNTFTESTPTRLCQQVLSAAYCLSLFQPCTPPTPTQENPAPIGGEKIASKPCKWLCEAVHSGDAGAICTQNDRDYLDIWGINLGQGTGSGLPELDCDNTDMWSDDDTTCHAVNGIIDEAIGDTCTLYDGDYCNGVFPAGTYVFVPGGTSIAQLESLISFDTILNAMPLDNDQCGAGLVRTICGTLMPECISDGFKAYADPNAVKADPDLAARIKKLNDNYNFPVSLRAPISSCEYYVEGCKTTAFYQNPAIALAIPLPNCPTQNNLRANQCFPTNLDPTKASDYVPPSPSSFQISTVDETEEYSYDEDQSGDKLVNMSSVLKHMSPLPSSFGTMGGMFDAQQSEQLPQQTWTLAQMDKINRMNKIYNFNALMNLAPFAYVEENQLGPESLLKSQINLRGHVFPGSFYQLFEKDVQYPTSCPSPLVQPTDYYNEAAKGVLNIYGGRCAIPCPSPAFTHTEYRDIEIATWIFTVFSMVFAIILSLTFLVFRSQRPKWILFNYSASYFGVVFFIFVGLLNQARNNEGFYNSQCSSPSTLEHMTGFSLFQAICIVFFLIASSGWWCMMAIDLFQRLILGHVYRRGSSQFTRRKVAFHIMSWGIAALCVIALISAAQLGYDGSLPFAFATVSPGATSTPIQLTWVFFFLPVLIFAAVGFGLVITILIFLVKHNPSAGLKKFADEMESTKSNFGTKFKNVLKLFGFVFLMVFFILFLIIYQLNFGANYSKWAKALTAWGEWRLFSGLSGGDLQIASRQSPSLIILVVFGVCSPGIVMFLLYFVFQTDVLQLWIGLLHFKLGLSVCSRFAKEDTMTGTDSGATGSSHGSSGSAGSSDIFGSVETLTNKKSHTYSEGTAVTQTLVISSLDEAPNSPTSTAFALPSGASVVSKASKEKRKTLFKGFSEPSKQSKSGMRARTSSPVRSSAGMETSPSGLQDVEMAQMGLILEIADETQGENPVYDGDNDIGIGIGDQNHDDQGSGQQDE
jgi:hypothetical protein